MLALSVMEVITFVTAVLIVTGLLGGSLALLFSQFKKNAGDYLRQENKDLLASLDAVRGRVEIMEESEAQCKQTLEKHEVTIQVLTDMVKGTSAVSELATMVAFNHDETVTLLRTIDSRLAQR